MRPSARIVACFPSRKDRWLVSVFSVTAAIEVIAAVVPMTIVPVAPSHSVNAALALSTRRLDLRCTNPDRHVLVSPQEPAAFIGALKRVKPTIVDV